MKRKYFIAIVAVLALFAACKNPAGNHTDTYTVTFDKNHSDPTGYTEANPKTKAVTTPATTVGTLPTAPKRTDYDFVKWTVNRNGSGAAFTATTTVDKSITVYAQWEKKEVEPPEIFTINLNITGNVSGDSVTALPEEGEAGDTITISYTLANDKNNNQLIFSGTTVQIDQVDQHGTGTREYTIDENDVIDGVITIDAAFTHTDESEPTPPPVDPVSPITYRNLFKELGGKTDAEVTAKVQGAYDRLFTGTETQKIYYEVAGDMAYILDSGNNDVRSEGMSYGMMMCVQMNDKAKFDRLWKWAHTYMYNDRTVKTDNIRGYFSWQCNTNGTVKDRNPAPDGEFYFVTALLFASARWGDGTGILEYGREARNILYDMIHRDSGGLDNWGAASMFNMTHKMPVFSTIGSAANHTDPSYHLPAFYEVWAVEIEEGEDYWNIWGGEAAARTDAQFYRDAANASRAFFKTTVHATTGLGPDYANFDGSPTGGEHQDFRYDAWRIAMNIGVDYAWWQKDSWQVEFADRIQSFFHGKGVTSYGALWNLNGNGPLQNGADHSPGLVACNAVASLAASHARRVDFINNFWDVPMTSGQYRYYDGCLYMLGMLHVSGNFKIYYPANRARSSTITPTTATFDKNTAGANYKDVAVTMTLNGNTLSNIKNGATTLTQGTHYTVSGNNVTIKKEYLAQQSNGTTTLTFSFSAGSARTIAITIGDTTGGGPIGGTGTEYNFATDSPAVSTVGTGITAVIENGVLKVTRTAGYGSATGVVIDFGFTDNISTYSKVEVKLKGSGDLTHKTMLVEISTASTLAAAGSNTTFGSVSTGNLGSSFVTLTANKSGSPSATGSVKVIISFGSTNPSVHEIESIKFIK